MQNSELGTIETMTIDSIVVKIILKEHIDPLVKRYGVDVGDLKPFTSKIWSSSILGKVDFVSGIVLNINVNDNSDMEIETTFRAEIGTTKSYGIFGISSPWSESPEEAIKQAFLCLLQQKKLSCTTVMLFS